jgi:hypothetical protein
VLRFYSFFAVSAALCSTAIAHADSEYDREAMVCPATPGQLDSAIYSRMHHTGFEQRNVPGGIHYTIRLEDGLVSKRYLDVQFMPFVLARSTRVVIKAYILFRPVDFRASPHDEIVTDPSMLHSLEDILSAMQEEMPCHG